MARASGQERLCRGAPEVILHEEVVVREGLRHLQERDQVARLLPYLPAGAALLRGAAQEQTLTTRLMCCARLRQLSAQGCAERPGS